VRFLSEQSGERKLEDRSFQYSSLCWRVLNSLAEQGKHDDLKQVFDALVKHEYIEPNNVLLGPMIKVHIVRQVLNSAFSICGVRLFLNALVIVRVFSIYPC
jgi:leucine-rich PPR motif-containing protein